MKTAIVLIYIWKSCCTIEQQEFPMPDMPTCLEAAKAAKVVSNGKDSTAVFCAYSTKAKP